MKKIIALLLLAVLCLTFFVSCEEADNAPDGMKLATCDGAEYRLYVPTVWNLNLAENISGAYYNLSTQSNVSVQKFVSAETGDNALRDFWNNHFLSVFKKLDKNNGCTPVFTDTVLDEQNAIKVEFNLNREEANYLVRQFVAIYNGAFYVLSFVMDTEIIETVSEDMEQIATEFIFCGAYEADDYQKSLRKSKAEAPANMQLASAEYSSYLFYIPSTWVIDRNTDYSCGYVESDKTNVAIIPYVVSVNYESSDEFFALIEEELKPLVNNYTKLTSSEELTVGGKKGYAYTYTYELNAKTYQIKQILVGHSAMVYSITYTALAENYSLHLDDFNTILSNFIWD